MNIKNTEIALLLVEYRMVKNNLQEINMELRKAAFEVGLNQEAIGKISINDFLDGYLVGQGIQRSHTKVEDNE